MNQQPAKTPLYDWHVEQGGRMVDFAGWSMPVQYASIVEEHHAIRRAAGVFDVSHMGRLRFDGQDAGRFLDRVLTRRVADLPPGKIRYSLVTNEQGGILDDILASQLETPSGQRYYLLVVNACNREKLVAWFRSQLNSADGDVEMADRTTETAMIAVQGPQALQVVGRLVKADLERMGYYTGVVTESFDRPCTVTRTGYTGEDGFELIVRAEDAVELCANLFRAGRDTGLRPAGLGARDTLRLEAGMPLYGHELSESINPYQAGLGFAVNLPDRSFVGAEALRRLQGDPQQPKRIGLTVAGRRVPREHYAVLAEGQGVGEVTSGTFSPTLDKPIAMAYVRADAAAPGTELAVEIRGRRESARVVELPFYRRGRQTA
ncbi:MAG: glycine cleavage system aminomethyltransferase GcvT [Candidatus Anammoximicrobium sp.]|nr:glycine cleavage system aminomethyltransferase GcvT [Candidatus Anammoximicrobium sp.]